MAHFARPHHRGMVHIGRHPSDGGMAIIAGIGHENMFFIFTHRDTAVVATCTVGGRPFEYTFEMASRATQVFMFSTKHESGGEMIKILGLCPSIRHDEQYGQQQQERPGHANLARDIDGI